MRFKNFLCINQFKILINLIEWRTHLMFQGWMTKSAIKNMQKSKNPLSVTDMNKFYDDKAKKGKKSFSMILDRVEVPVEVKVLT